MTDVAPGAYTLVAERNGYVARREARSAITVTAGSDVRNVVLRLAPAAAITGRVFNEDGDPVPYASVEALQRGGFPRGPRTVPVRSAQTNDLGEYRLFGLPPGRYLLRATLSDHAPSGFTGYRTKSDTEMTYPPVYYPDVTSMDAASFYDVRAGTESRADFHLVRIAGVTLRGRVTGLPKSEQPVRANVILRSGFQQGGNAVVQEDGSFEMRGIVPGTYSLDAYAPEFVAAGTEPKMRTAHQKITVSPGQNEEIILNLQAAIAGEIPGRIRVEGAAPKLDRIFISLVPAQTRDDDDEVMAFGRGGGSGSVQADGSFRLRVNGRGPFRVILSARASGLEDYYTKTVLYGGRDVTESGFTFTGTPANLEITVSSAGATIEGSVVDGAGKAVANATVIAIPDGKLREQYELYEPATTDQNGHFLIRGQRPGNYSVFAFLDLHGQEYFDPNFVKQYEDQAQSLHAEANGHHQLALKVIPGRDSD